MARDLYPGTLVQLASGASAPNTAFTIWTDLTSGTDVTGQVLGSDGATPYTAVTDGNGLLVPFRGPDATPGPLFIDTGIGQRQMLMSSTAQVGLFADVTTLKATVATLQAGGGGGGVTDHGALSGLLDDDHPQYLNVTRGDARYYTQTVVDGKVTVAATASSAADRDRTNHTGTQIIGTISGLQDALDSKRFPAFASQVGALQVTVGVLRMRVPIGCVIDYVTVAVGTAPAGASLIVDVNRNGTSIFAAANRPTLTAGSTGLTVAGSTAATTVLAGGDYLTVDVDQVGSTTAGADLTVGIWLRF